MASISKSGTPSLASQITQQHKLTGAVVGEDIAAGDACRVHTDGKIYRSDGASAATADIHGYALESAKVAQGDALTLASECRLNYGKGLTPGTKLYLSATVKGGLDTAASTNVTKSCGYVCHDGARVKVKECLQ